MMAAPSLLRISLSSEHLTQSKIQDARKQTAACRDQINMQEPRDARMLKTLEAEGPINTRAGFNKSTVHSGVVSSQHF